MTWAPSHLTRKQLEERRLKGGQLLRQGRLSQAQIARRLGVSRATVSEWAGRLHRGKLADLRARPAPGRPVRLTLKQQPHLVDILNGGARAAGFATERWTLARIQQVVVREFAVNYHPHYIGELLHRWGWSCQQPIERARNRDDTQVAQWLKTDWPRIKKKQPGST